MNAASGGPKGERSESNPRTTCTLRFLRAVRVQTGCANNAWWDRLLVLMYTKGRCVYRTCGLVCSVYNYCVNVFIN
ncbi:hypothetical protein EKI35_14630 [Salmonella enterica]|nr:hypothetical protein [Salmonella enterica]EAN4231090.1 hypothetical protein [Salmonella enterica]MGI90822.1 hypothetical protein [Salmonella enterica]